ncbi:NUDIX hydrolase [uncultured Tateyamaria sp.]|uniref:NUDIX hydrolase n=1 Tax=uncultured Tateyamaria sp. TaxID=455651 RepID=UPI002629C0DD|nr:NUDIX hydrolase [uncultured Tateyamaria sp.]
MAGRVIGAKLALFVGEDLATLQRDDRPGLMWAGYWDLPGGGIEPGETPLNCVLRETHEELSLVIAPELITWGRDYGTSSGDISWFFAAHLPADTEAQIVLGDEGQGWALMSIAAFMAHDRVVPQFKPRLGDYLAGVVSGHIDRSG